MPDIADTRLANTLALFDEFVRSTVVGPAGQELKGLEARFAGRLQIAPSYWSQLKSRNRQIGETLARQFESHFQRPHGWLDESHAAGDRAPAPAGAENDDERFLVQMLLTCYRMNPAGVKQRMLELMEGELAKAAARPADARPQQRRR